MKLTNRLNLPAPLFRAIEWQQSQHSVGEADLSCTQLIDSPLIAWLWRKFGDQVQEDASERLWPLCGTLAHTVLEQFAGEGEHVETEEIALVTTGCIVVSIPIVFCHTNSAANLFHQCIFRQWNILLH